MRDHGSPLRGPVRLEWKEEHHAGGDGSIFAVESEITYVVPSISQCALGFFVIHLGGRIFGVKEPDASMLGCSFSEVDDRVRRRGTHAVPFLDDIDATRVAEAYLDAIYRDTPGTDYFGLSRQAFSEAVHSNAVIWAPDGDAAFDDGSHVLQFDVGSRVRLVAFVNTNSPEDLCGTIIEEWLEADLFYDVLSRWKTLFAAEWARRVERKG